MNGYETLSYLLKGGILKLEDAPPYCYIYRLTESGLEAKSTDPEAFGLDKRFTYLPASLDWLMTEEFIVPEGYHLSIQEASEAMSMGAKVEPEGYVGFYYSWGDHDNMELYWDGDLMEENVQSFSEEEINGMWRVVT